MKKLMLFVAGALSTAGFSQDVKLSNVRIKTDSYRSYEIVDYMYPDSTWSPYDSLTMVFNDFTYKLYGLEALFGPDTTTGVYLYDMEPVERLVGFTKSKETFDFNFTDSTLTRVVNGKRFTEDIISYYLSYDLYNLENEDLPYHIDVVTEDGYERGYDVNFNNGTIEYNVKSKDATRSFTKEFTRRTNVIEFKKY